MLLTFLKNKFSTQNERSAKALKHIILSFVYKGGNMLINLMLVPITINLVLKMNEVLRP
jgi:predicted metal-dependent RNase